MNNNRRTTAIDKMVKDCQNMILEASGQPSKKYRTIIEKKMFYIKDLHQVNHIPTIK